jgi:hypothetical protein
MIVSAWMSSRQPAPVFCCAPAGGIQGRRYPVAARGVEGVASAVWLTRNLDQGRTGERPGATDQRKIDWPVALQLA